MTADNRHDDLLLHNMVSQFETPERAFSTQFGDLLIKHHDAIVEEESAWGPSLDLAAAILRNEAPLHFNHALLRANGHSTGCFTIQLSSRIHTPIMVFCYRNAGGGDEGDPHLGDYGYVLSTHRHRIANRRRHHYGPAVQMIDQVLANGGLYGFCTWTYDEATAKFVRPRGAHASA